MPGKRKFMRLKVATVLLLVVIPCILVVGVLFGDRNYAVTSPLILLLSMLPFFLVFEKRRPQARELVPIAVMAAIAAVSRVAFSFIPQFSPVVAVVVITALAFGPEAGFLTGALSMLASNFFRGQGPWTPWQMFCCGIIGFLAGLLWRVGWLKQKWSICLFGFLSGFLYGAIIDFWTLSVATSKSLLAIYAAAIPADATLGAATAIFLFILEKPLLKKLERIKTKYGLLDKAED